MLLCSRCLFPLSKVRIEGCTPVETRTASELVYPSPGTSTFMLVGLHIDIGSLSVYSSSQIRGFVYLVIGVASYNVSQAPLVDNCSDL